MEKISNTVLWRNRVSRLTLLGLCLPFLLWVNRGLTGNLGAEPIVELNKGSGMVVLSLLVINLWIGVFLRFSFLPPKILTVLLHQRRPLGVAAGVYLIFHFLTYLGKEAFEPVAWSQILTKLYLTMGFAAALWIWLMTVTSNSLSLRKLGGRRWRQIHRGVHWACLLILIHVFSIEKADLIFLALIVLPLIPFQLFRLWKCVN